MVCDNEKCVGSELSKIFELGTSFSKWKPEKYDRTNRNNM